MRVSDGIRRRISTICICFLVFSLLGSGASAVTLSLQNLTLAGPGNSGSSVLILDSAPGGVAGYNINVTMGTPGIANITGVVFPSAFAAMNNKTALPAQEVRVVGVDVTKLIESGASNITLCTFTMEGTASGDSGMQLSIGELTDDAGNPIDATLKNAMVTVGSATPSPTPTVTPTLTPTLTPTPTLTGTPTVTPTFTPTPGTVDFSAFPLSGSAPLTVSFTPIVNGTVSGYVWSFGDGTSSDQANPSHLYSNGTYDVALLATFVSGGSACASKTGYITVNGGSPTPIPTVTPTPTPTPVPLVANFTATPVTGVPPLSVQFMDLSLGTPTTWKWNFGDGMMTSTKDPLHVYGGIGRYTVTLEVENRDMSSIIRKIEFVKTKG
ncbi:MAG: PKD domain-containing protein [Methanobacteriota archaeon]